MAHLIINEDRAPLQPSILEALGAIHSSPENELAEINDMSGINALTKAIS
jgi:hypothetical protein